MINNVIRKSNVYDDTPERGPAGASAYEQAVSGGFKGSEKDFIEILGALETITQAGSDAVQLAKDWASKTDGPVADGAYSAKKYAQDAAASQRVIERAVSEHNTATDAHAAQINLKMPKTIGSGWVPENAPDAQSVYQAEILGGSKTTGFLNAKFVAGDQNVFLCAHLKPDVSVACNYGSEEQVKRLFSGHYNGWDWADTTDFEANPFVLEIKSNNPFEVTDVAYLCLFGHRLGSICVMEDYKIEILTSVGTDWKEVMGATGKAVTGCPVFALHTGTGYDNIYGVRLTISKASGIFALAAVELRAGRSNTRFIDSVGGLPIDGGDLYGDVNFIKGLPKVNGVGVVLANQCAAANGVASLDEQGKVPQGQLPQLPYLPLTGGAVDGNIEVKGGTGYFGNRLCLKGQTGHSSWYIAARDYGEITIQNADNNASFNIQQDGIADTSAQGVLLGERDKGVAGGVASLDADALLEQTQRPIASQYNLGCVKAGKGVTVAADGTISAGTTFALEQIGPDYTRPVTLSSGTEYTKTQSGWVRIYHAYPIQVTCRLTVNGVVVWNVYGAAQAQVEECITVFVGAGDTFVPEAYNANGSTAIVFYPCKGEI